MAEPDARPDAVQGVVARPAGDQAIEWVAGLLKETVSEKGLAIRYGGDEFMVLAPGSDRSAARELGNRLLERVRDSPVELDDRETVVSLTLSIGVATALEDGDGRKVLTRQADNALYHAKQSGRNRLSSVDEIDSEDASSRTALHRLEEARIADEIARIVRDACQAVEEEEEEPNGTPNGPTNGQT